EREQAADPAVVDPLDDLRRGRPLPGERLHGNAPAPGDVRPVLRVLDVACARQLVAPLAVLARALPVALSGDGRVAAAALADLPGGGHEVDAREPVVDTFGVMLDAARVQQHRARRLPPQLAGLDDATGGDADELLAPLGSVRFDARRDGLEAARVRR